MLLSLHVFDCICSDLFLEVKRQERKEIQEIQKVKEGEEGKEIKKIKEEVKKSFLQSRRRQVRQI